MDEEERHGVQRSEHHEVQERTPLRRPTATANHVANGTRARNIVEEAGYRFDDTGPQQVRGRPIASRVSISQTGRSVAGNLRASVVMSLTELRSPT